MMRSYGGLTNRRFLLTMSSCVLVGPTQYEPTFANYIRENERIEAIRRLKLSPLTIRRKGSLFPIMSVLKKNLILQRARGYCPTTRKWIGYSGNTSADSCAFVGGSSRSLGCGCAMSDDFQGPYWDSANPQIDPGPLAGAFGERWSGDRAVPAIPDAVQVLDEAVIAAGLGALMPCWSL
jgi:hypothetical protein